MVQRGGIGNVPCVSGVQVAGDAMMIVRDIWLKSVLAVFDVGAAEMRFAVRY